MDLAIERNIYLIFFILIITIVGILIFFIFFFFIGQRKKQIYEQEFLNSKIEVQESTLKTVSRELHDNISQLLTLAKITASKNPENRIITDYVNEALKEIRKLSKVMNEEYILSKGLIDAITYELDRLSASGFVKTKLDSNVDFLEFEPKKELILFRIFQELLQNSLKHAQAKQFTVNIEKKGSLVSIHFHDDGIGFKWPDTKVTTINAGSGLQNIQSRIKLIGGLILINTPTSGTHIEIKLPI